MCVDDGDHGRSSCAGQRSSGHTGGRSVHERPQRTLPGAGERQHELQISSFIKTQMSVNFDLTGHLCSRSGDDHQ